MDRVQAELAEEKDSGSGQGGEAQGKAVAAPRTSPFAKPLRFSSVLGFEGAHSDVSCPWFMDLQSMQSFLLRCCGDEAALRVPTQGSLRQRFSATEGRMAVLEDITCACLRASSRSCALLLTRSTSSPPHCLVRSLTRTADPLYANSSFRSDGRSSRCVETARRQGSFERIRLARGCDSRKDVG
jgi:hypothetical protein